jgi:hypothetical protein
MEIALAKANVMGDNEMQWTDEERERAAKQLSEQSYFYQPVAYLDVPSDGSSESEHLTKLLRTQMSLNRALAQLSAMREERDMARETNRKLNRENQDLQSTLNVETGRKAWRGYFYSTLSILREEKISADALKAKVQSLEATLEGVKGQNASLLSQLNAAMEEFKREDEQR